MKEKNNQRAASYDRLIVRAVEQCDKMQRFFIDDVPEAGREDAAETVNLIKIKFQVFEHLLREAKQAYLIGSPESSIKESECLDEAFGKLMHMGNAINDAPRIRKAAKEAFFSELGVIEDIMDSLMDNMHVVEHDVQKAKKHDDGSLDASWENRLKEKLKKVYENKRGH